MITGSAGGRLRPLAGFSFGLGLSFGVPPECRVDRPVELRSDVHLEALIGERRPPRTLSIT